MIHQAIFYMLITGVLWTLVGIIYGKAPDKQGDLYSFLALNGFCYTLFIWSVHFPQKAPPPEVLHLALYMIPATVIEMTGFLLLKYAMTRGSQGIAWSIAQSSMVIPFLGAILFLGNHAGAVKYTGAAVLLSGLILVGLKKKGKEQPKSGQKGFLLYAFSAFLLVGIAQFMRIIPGNAGFSEAALSWRLPVSAPCGMIIWGYLAIARHGFVPGKVWKLAVPYAIVTALGQIFFFLAVDASDPLGITAIVYPVAVGCSIFLFSSYCVWWRREELPMVGRAGIILIVLGIVLLSLG